MAAAITAARQNADVTILEHMDRVGKKLLSTGNGKCNLTNMNIREECYRCSQKGFPMKVLSKFGVEDTLSFFDELGLMTKNKNGYLYPNSEQASTVLDLLRLELSRRKILVVNGCRVKKIRHENSPHRFKVETDSKTFQGDSLILAAGSKAAPFTGSDGSGYELAKDLGHRVILPLPALVQLRCEGSHFKALAGVRCEAQVSLYCDGKRTAEDLGEVQLTDYGISGIPVFQVSRFASRALAEGKNVKAVLDFLPSLSTEETRTFFSRRRERLGHLACSDFLAGIFHKKLAAVLLKQSGIPAGQLTGQTGSDAWNRLLKKIKCFESTVTATNSFEQAQVCCGGVDTRQIRPENLESRLVPGLYVTGELLDVDGICGGYNLQWAWSTGCLAGKSAGG